MNRILFSILLGSIFFIFSTVPSSAQEDDASPLQETPAVKHFPFYVVTKENMPANELHLSDNGVPIPPRRPKIMKVSPSYIEELRNRSRTDVQDKMDSETIEGEPVKKNVDENPLNVLPTEDKTKLSSLLPLPDDIFDTKEDPPEAKPIMPELTEIEVLLPIEMVDKIPVPPTLPEQRMMQIAQKNPVDPNDRLAMQLNSPDRLEILKVLNPNALAPAAGDMDNSRSEQEKESEAVISFALKPEQIHIDPAIESFLATHALEMFKKNKNLKMEIQSYATPVDGDEYSPIRISLARALEIRRFLIDKGVSPARLKLKTMTQNDDISDDDRIDLVLIK